MKKYFILFTICIITSSLSAQEGDAYTNIENLFNSHGTIKESNIFYKEGKNYQNPFRRIDFSYAKYEKLEDNTIVYGIKLACITDYLTKQNRLFYIYLDTDEVSKFILWLKDMQSKIPELSEFERTYYVPIKGSSMFAVFKENDKNYIQFVPNKHDLSTAVSFDFKVLEDLLYFLGEVKKTDNYNAMN